MLTAHDARAIKSADALCFDRNKDGSGQIRAIRRAENSSSGFEETHTVETDRCGVNNYGTGSVSNAFAMIVSAQRDDVARTLVRHMRAGSKVALVWTRGNASPVTDNAGLVRDELRVKVQNGKTCDTFLVQVYIGLDNSARMVQSTLSADALGLKPV